MRSEPHALLAKMRWTPRLLSAQMLAREGSSVGEIVCPRPCRGKKRSRVLPSVPVTIESEGVPNGVLIWSVSTSLSCSSS